MEKCLYSTNITLLIGFNFSYFNSTATVHHVFLENGIFQNLKIK